MKDKKERNVKTEKTENRKALPGFVRVFLISGLIGGVLGFLSGVAGASSLPEILVQGIEHGLTVITPWSIWVLSAVLLGMGALKYRDAKQLFAAWDGEDERTVEQAEQQLNWSSLTTSLLLVLDFFFFGVGLQLVESVVGDVVFLLSFVVSMAGLILLQQKVVDLTRKINPEKQVSVYDIQFRKKWLASCDENELRQIGQAAYKSFAAVTYVCLGLWAVLVLMNNIWDVGILPIFLVMLIWGVSQVVYLVECLRMGRPAD